MTAELEPVRDEDVTDIRMSCRAIVCDRKTNRFLLVRNEGQSYWYAPGGGLENETRKACAERETLEETGVRVRASAFLLNQTMFIEPLGKQWFEYFYLAEPTHGAELPFGHRDEHGSVKDARWFTVSEMEKLIVLPEAIVVVAAKLIEKESVKQRVTSDG